MEHLFRWPELELVSGALERCDAKVRQLYGSHAEQHTSAGSGVVPPVRELWPFAPNPHAHLPPRECYSNTQHGVRNSYWMAFRGAVAEGGKEEL